MNSGVPQRYQSSFGRLAVGRRPSFQVARDAVRAGLLLLGLFSTLLFASSALGATATVGLGSATSFSVLAGSTVTNTGPTVMSGDLGLYPGTSVTGAPVALGQTHVNDTVAIEAKNALTTAFTDAKGRPSSGSAGTELAGQEFSPGVYTASSSLLLSSGSVTLNANGDPNGVFIFQIGSTLETLSGTTVALVGRAQACNVFWQIGSSATLGAGSSFVGTLMAADNITANSAATIEGRLLAETEAVNLHANTISTSTCTTGGGGGTEVSLGGATPTGGSLPTTTSAATTTSLPPIGSRAIAKKRVLRRGSRHHRARRAAKRRSQARPTLPRQRGSFTG